MRHFEALAGGLAHMALSMPTQPADLIVKRTFKAKAAASDARAA